MNIEKAGEKTSHAILILDASGSMSSIKDKTIKSVNEFIQAQKTSTIPTYISFITFSNNEVKTIIDYKPAYMVEELTDKDYSTYGMTNLLDAVGTVISKVNSSLKSINDLTLRPSVIISIVTDGGENSSKEYNYENIKKHVAECEKNNWAFLFLGANIDAFAESAKLGFGTSNTMQYDVDKIDTAVTMMSNATELLKASRSMGVDVSVAYTQGLISDEDRKSVV